MPKLTIALAKGRLQDQALAGFARRGLLVSDQALASRRLMVEDESKRFSFISRRMCPFMSSTASPTPASADVTC
jgi:ATP phosphoribosyltransferase